MNNFPPRLAYPKKEVMPIIEEVFDFYNKQGLDPGYQGEFEKRYTDKLVDFMGSSGYADAVSSGTAAVYVALKSLELTSDSIVLVSPVTDPGTINAIILAGLIPKLVDSKKNSYNTSLQEIKHRYDDDCKALVVVHIGGIITEDMNQIKSFCDANDLFLVEDCAQSHGAINADGFKAGSFGDISVFSTMYRKNHSTGGCGGVVYTKDFEKYKLIRAYADRGKPFFDDNFDEKNPSSFMFPALNFNLDEISCALGIYSLSKLEEINYKRRVFIEKLSVKLNKNNYICKIVDIKKGDTPFFWTFEFIESFDYSMRDKFFSYLSKNGIPINENYSYVACEWDYAKKYFYDEFQTNNAIKYKNSTFNILFNENFEYENIDFISKIINSFE